MRFGSVCSGIEAASAAWNPLGWKAAWFSEIEAFPSAVLAHHHPDVPNLGDMTLLPGMIRSGEVEAPDVFCGGTPCQAFSVAGKRQSLDDARGNLSLIFCEIANAIDDIRHDRGEQPSIVFWENVPGVFSTKDNAFGCFLAQLCGGDEPLHAPDGWPDAGCVSGERRTAAWRVLDAQYFGLAQRRRRVFVVASARNGFDPCEVLFEFNGVRRDSAPSREAREEVAPTIAGCANGGGANGPGRDVDSVESLQIVTMAHGQAKAEIAFDRGPTLACNHEAPIVAFPASLSGTQCASTENLSPALGAMNPTAVAQASVGVADPLYLRNAMQVRRLTPRECERLQGFPDDWTLVPHRGKPAADGPRYKSLGNSWAVPVVAWIGKRIHNHLKEQV